MVESTATPTSTTLDSRSLKAADPEVWHAIAQERRRQNEGLELIASENYVSGAVLAATGSVLTNKYSEGYPGKRYYEGQKYIDRVEQLCIDRAKSLFGVDHANPQPYSGSPANLAVYFAFLKPGETVMGMGLPAGGHLTHGWNVSITGSYFKSVQYGVRRDTHRIDMDEVRELARKEKPKLMYCGGTAIPRTIDFEAFGEFTTAEAGTGLEEFEGGEDAGGWVVHATLRVTSFELRVRIRADYARY